MDFCLLDEVIADFVIEIIQLELGSVTAVFVPPIVKSAVYEVAEVFIVEINELGVVKLVMTHVAMLIVNVL